jgi:hypothetical protein
MDSDQATNILFPIEAIKLQELQLVFIMPNKTYKLLKKFKLTTQIHVFIQTKKSLF